MCTEIQTRVSLLYLSASKKLLLPPSREPVPIASPEEPYLSCDGLAEEQEGAHAGVGRVAAVAEQAVGADGDADARQRSQPVACKGCARRR